MIKIVKGERKLWQTTEDLHPNNLKSFISYKSFNIIGSSPHFYTGITRIYQMPKENEEGKHPIRGRGGIKWGKEQRNIRFIKVENIFCIKKFSCIDMSLCKKKNSNFFEQVNIWKYVRVVSFIFRNVRCMNQGKLEVVK